VIEAPLPVVVTVSNELGAARAPSLRETMRAARKPVVTWAATDLGLSRSEVGAGGARRVLERLFVPAKKGACELVAGFAGGRALAAPAGGEAAMSARGVMVVAELAAGKPTSVSRELLGLARQLVAKIGGPVCTICPAADEALIADLVAHGADRVYTAGDRARRLRRRADRVHGMGGARGDPAAVLMICKQCRSRAPARSAWKLRRQPDVSAWARRGRAALQPARNSFLQHEGGGGYVRRLQRVPRDESGARTNPVRQDSAARAGNRRQRESGGDVRLEDAQVVIAGARSRQAGVSVLARLASCGALGASRVPYDLGWCPHSCRSGSREDGNTGTLYRRGHLGAGIWRAAATRATSSRSTPTPRRPSTRRRVGGLWATTAR
jgi:hypothetical protein